MITRQQDISLKTHNTFGIEATCREWVEFTDIHDLPEIAEIVNDSIWMVLGEGSNTLFTDDYNGVILHSGLTDLEFREKDDIIYLKAGSGLSLDRLIESLCRSDIWGLENLSGIPGTVGASAVQNVGAYGVEACDVVDSVECFDTRSRSFINFQARECAFAYRNSRFKSEKGRYIITSVTYRLSKIPCPVLSYGKLSEVLGSRFQLSPMEVREAVIAFRNEKLPRVEEYGSAGSFFKNPVITQKQLERLQDMSLHLWGDIQVPFYPHGNDRVKVPAAWLIERCGFKGRSFGNVAVWEKQPLVIVNLTGQATAQEIIMLAANITAEVKEKFGIDLQPEVEFIPANCNE